MSLASKFQEFDTANPQVWEQVVKFARILKAAGHKVLSIALIVERVRWEIAMATTGDAFKINNNWRAFYVRRLNAMPEFEGMFRTRTQRSA